MHLTGKGQEVLTSQYTVVEYIPAARSLSRCRFHSKISGIACVDSRARDHEQGRGGEARRDGMQKGRPAASSERAEIKQDEFGENHVVTKEAEKKKYKHVANRPAIVFITRYVSRETIATNR